LIHAAVCAADQQLLRHVQARRASREHLIAVSCQAHVEPRGRERLVRDVLDQPVFPAAVTDEFLCLEQRLAGLDRVGDHRRARFENELVLTIRRLGQRVESRSRCI
jgi:hypothetical protein